MGKLPSVIRVEFAQVTMTNQQHQQKTPNQARLLEDGAVTIDKRTVFYDDSRRKFKASDIVEVTVEHHHDGATDTIAIRTCKDHNTTLHCQGPLRSDNAVSPKSRLSALDAFVERLKSFQKANQQHNKEEQQHISPRKSLGTKKSPRRTFAKRGKKKLLLQKQIDDRIPWEDDDEAAVDVPDDDKRQASSDQQEKHNNSSDLMAEEAKSMESDDDSAIFGQSKTSAALGSANKRRSTSSSSSLKKSKRHRRAIVDNDTDDDEDEASATTPSMVAAHRQVSPSHTASAVASAAAGDSDDDDLAAPLPEHEQPKISTYFTAKKKPRTSFDSKTNVELQKQQQRTPEPQIRHALLSSTTSRKSRSPARRQLHHHSTGDWLSTTQAATASPKRVQAAHLFGSSQPRDHKQATAEDAADPIAEFDDDHDIITTTPPRANQKQPLGVLQSAPTLPIIEGGQASSGFRRRRFQKRTGVATDASPLSPLPLASSKDSHRKLLLPAQPPKVLDALPPPRRRHRGLRNLGNTCYMNASIQMIANWCLSQLNVVGTDKNNDAAAAPLATSLVQIVRELMAEIPQQTNLYSQMILNPIAVKNAMDSKTYKFVGYEQRDAHEFISDMLDCIHEELDKAHPNKTLPTDDFRLVVQVHLQCTCCGYLRTKEEMYRHLSIDLPLVADNNNVDSMAHLPDSLDQFFQPEVRELRCEKCENGTHAKQTMKIKSRPKRLLLHLKRFVVIEKPREPAPATGGDENAHPNSPSVRKEPVMMDYVFQKNKVPVEILPELSLAPYHLATSTKKQDDATHKGEYELESMVHHIGRSAASGHYTADALRPLLKQEKPQGKPKETNNDGAQSAADAAPKEPEDDHVGDEYDKLAKEKGLEWTAFDDTQSSRYRMAKIRESKTKQRTVYMLLYTLKEPTQPINL